jgi:hypothetical protein
MTDPVNSSGPYFVFSTDVQPKATGLDTRAETGNLPLRPPSCS